MNKKKLLIVSDYFYPHWTGISKVIYYLIRAIKNDFDITVLTVKHLKQLKKEETIFSAKVIREDFICSFSRSKYSLIMILKFMILIKNYDIIFINSPSANILPLSFITKIFRKKLIIFHHGDLILPKGVFNRIIEKIFDISSFFSFLLANKLCTFTQDYADNSRVLRIFLYKFSRLMLPVYPTKKSKSFKYLDEIKKLKKENKKILGFAGRFVEEKGFDILFDAIPKIVKLFPRVHFVFAGETNISYENFYQKNLSKIKQNKKYLTFLGLLKDQELQSFYKIIDFIILPSRSDCFPQVQVEAMLNGIPAIVSDIPGARYLVNETGFGILFKKEDSDDLAKKVVFAIKNKKEIMKHHKKVLKILDKEKNVKEIKKNITS